MTVERSFIYNKDKKMLFVQAITRDEFTDEQVKTVVSDLKGQLDNANKSIEKYDKLKWSFKKIDTEPRTKELVEIVFDFLPQVQLPDRESIDKTLKYWTEQKIRIESDLKELEQYVNSSK